ncbi:MAG: cobalamin-binding protein [Isosphaeraceae bacterium]
MRIVSLLPALTELVAALGLMDALVGVTHECDFPPGVETLPHLTRSRISPSASSGAIDAAVAALGEGLYELDGTLLERLRPDLILTQAQCVVCAVGETVVRERASSLAKSPHVESVNPVDLAGVHSMFRQVGDLLGARAASRELISRFDATRDEVDRRLRQAKWSPRPTLLLEWLDPPYSSGHWNPEIIALAGGLDVVATPGDRSRRLTWEEVHRADPEVLILSPCGFTLERSAQELPVTPSGGEWSILRAVENKNVVLVDGSAYYSRPGPRLLESLKITAAAIAPQLFADFASVPGWACPLPV